MILPFTLAALALLALVAAGFVLLDRRVRATRERVVTELHQLYRQLEALQGLYVELEHSPRLPSMRGFPASPDVVLLLVTEARARRPRVVVECGSGSSTVALARRLQLDGGGHVYSLEHEAGWAEETRRMLARAGLTQWATVIHAPLRDHELRGEQWPWYATDRLPDAPIDILFVDGPPGGTRRAARYPAGPLLFPRLASEALVVLDDADRPDERWVLEQWRAEFPELRQRMLLTERGAAVLERGARD